jgi:hypothetical protein
MCSHAEIAGWCLVLVTVVTLRTSQTEDNFFLDEIQPLVSFHVQSRTFARKSEHETIREVSR